MSDTKPQPDIIVIPRARLAFARIHKPEIPTDPQGRPRANAKARFSCTLLLDPSSKDQAASVNAIKQAALKVVVAKWGPKDQGGWPKADPRTGMGGLVMCFGNGNDLNKVYDGYKDMFYVKLSDTSRPLLGNRAGGVVAEGDKECPYSGCYVRARISPWAYPTKPNPVSANGVNFNFLSLQFVEDGPGFGGGGTRNPDEEFDKSMAGDAPKSDAFDDIAF